MTATGHPLRLYDEGLRASGASAVTVRAGDGTAWPLALEQYLGAADATDQALLAGVAGPVLDVGCGPGRHLHALAQRGVFALGVDLSPVAVGLARGRGARAIVGSVFDELPGAHRWRTALLLDGNIGIGGAPVRLLERLHDLLDDEGEVIAELSAPGSPTGAVRVRLEGGGRSSPWFAWARIAGDQIGAIAADGGFATRVVWETGGRWFARLSRSPAG